MTVYLVHFDEPYQHAQHYLGWCKDGTDPEESVERRLAVHYSGRGSRLMSVIQQAGITWRVSRIWPGWDQGHERRMKGHSSTRLCPLCCGEAAFRRKPLDVAEGCR